jgi:hypothetical protein
VGARGTEGIFYQFFNKMDMCWKYNESNKRLKVVLQISSNEAKFELLAQENRFKEAHPATPRDWRATFRCGGVFRELSDTGSERSVFVKQA